MLEFYKLRLAKHQKKIMKYLKYVMNDHFILVCMIGLGGFGYYYSEYLKTLDSSVTWMPIVVVSIWFVSLFIGSLSTLMQEADAVFLLPKERAMTRYLKRSLNYSMIFPTVSLSLIVGVTFPLIVATKGISFSMAGFIIVSLITLKYADLWIQLESNYLNTKKRLVTHRMIWSLGSLISLLLSIFVSFYIGLVIAIVISVILVTLARKTLSDDQLDWEKSISVERKRMKRIYFFFNLFTDVPGLASDVHRRKYLDGVLNKIRKTSDNTYLYLYARVVARGSEYSGLIIRLIIVGSVLLFFTQSFWLMAILGSLFIYLIGFQLIPMYHAFDYMLMTQLYPISYKQKSKAVLKIIRYVLILTLVVYALISFIVLNDKIQVLELAGVFLGITVLLSFGYIPMRLKKIEKTKNR